MTKRNDPAIPKFEIINSRPSAGSSIRRLIPIHLSLVIALAVASICLWGTLVGSMLPLIFRRLGVDPGIASSPFVATFVDVTGIVIYFSIARFAFERLSRMIQHCI